MCEIIRGSYYLPLQSVYSHLPTCILVTLIFILCLGFGFDPGGTALCCLVPVGSTHNAGKIVIFVFVFVYVLATDGGDAQTLETCGLDFAKSRQQPPAHVCQGFIRNKVAA